MSKIILRFSLLASVILLAGAGCFNLNQNKTIPTSGAGGFYVTTDSGSSWKQISLLPQADGVKNLNAVSVFRLIEDPGDPNAMYWASRDKGLLFTYDSGRTWQQASSPMDKGYIYGVAVHPENRCTIFATEGYKVYKSVDCSRSWTEVYREDNVNARISSLMFEPWGDSRIFMTKLNGDLLVSADLGLTWTVNNRFKLRIENIIADNQHENLLYVVSRDRGPYRSDDGGVTWVSLADKIKQFPGSTAYRRIFVNPTKSDMVYWISSYGILISTDRGDNWTPLKLISSPGSIDIYGFAVNPKNEKEMYYTSTLQNRSTLFRTEDGGENWSTKKLPSGQLPVVLRFHPEQVNILYVGFNIPIQS